MRTCRQMINTGAIKHNMKGMSGMKNGALFLAVMFLTAANLSSCVPSYPKEKLPEMVKEICRIEYKMDVDVTMEGGTLGIYYPMKGLLDAGLGVSTDAWDKISNLILVASRVVLSTDADIHFYCVITQDERLPEVQIVVIKYVEDVKRGMYQDISRDESFKRTLFSINLTPQAQKERSIQQVFDKLGVDDSTRENVMQEFFRSPPTKLSDIGYWKGNFYLKDVKLEEFLAAQMVNRIKIDFRKEKNIDKMFDYGSAEGFFTTSDNRRIFTLKYKIFDHGTKGQEIELRNKKLGELLRIASETVYGYEYKDFDLLELEDQLTNSTFWAQEKDVYDFIKKKPAVQAVIRTSPNFF